MGKKIDYFVLTAGITVGFYLYIRSAVQSRTLALVLSILCCAVVNRLFKRIFRFISGSSYAKKRQLRKKAGGALMHLACMDSRECHEKLDQLLEKIYGSRYNSELIQRHPASAVEISDIFALWKVHHSEEALVIFSTAHADEVCRSLTSELKNPKVALLDAAAISQMIAQHPQGMFPETDAHIRAGIKLRRLASVFINRKNAPRCMLMCFSMLLIYVFSFNILYLIAALFLLTVALASLRRRNSPLKLF